MSSSAVAARRRGIGGRLAIVVTGPSGAGKNSVIKRVLDELPRLVYSVSHTTRPRREGEADGVDYVYVSRDEFERLIRDGKFVEHMTYLGDHYGTSRAQIEKVFAHGDDLILNLDVEGAKSLRRTGLDDHTVVYVFLAPPTLEHLARRLRARGSESDAEISERLRVAEHEMGAIGIFDYLVINDDFDDAVAELRSVIVAERSRICSPGPQGSTSVPSRKDGST
jgi:guanylate kinase